MPRRRVSESKDGVIQTGIAFCSETGKRLDNVRYNTRELIRESNSKNTSAQGVVKALFETEPQKSENLRISAESVLSNLHERAQDLDHKTEDELNFLGNFAKLEKRSKKVKIRKVKKENSTIEGLDPKLRTIIESIIDEKIAKA